jgi:site-specific DNA recombinase
VKIIGYVRLSRATEESTSIARQRQVLAQVCETRGWQLVGIEEDNDVSASRARLNRPGLNAVRQAVRDGRADAVLVWRLDRLARSVVDFGTLLDEGLQIISATEPLDTTSSMGRAMAEILQVFAAMEARAIGARVSSARRHLPTVGRFPGGPPPYGYRPTAHPSGVGRALEHDPEEARVVRRIVDEVLAGRSIAAIVGDLNADGIPPRRGPSWHLATVTRMLRSDSLRGRVRSGGVVVRDETGLPVEAWPPLVTPEEGEILRARFTRTPNPGRAEESALGRRRASRMLSGVILCHSCGRPLTARHTKSETLRSTYSCMTRTRGLVCASPVNVRADEADREVERRFLAAFGRLPVVELREVVRDDLRIRDVEAAIADTTDELRRPDADLGALVDRLTSLRTERERLADLPSVPTVEAVETGYTFAEAWATGDYLARRSLLQASGAVVELHPPAIRGKWNADRISVEFPPDELGAIDLD